MIHYQKVRHAILYTAANVPNFNVSSISGITVTLSWSKFLLFVQPLLIMTTPLPNPTLEWAKALSSTLCQSILALVEYFFMHCTVLIILLF